MYTRSRNNDARVTLIRNDIPTIIFKPEVLFAQSVIVAECKDEVGWVGLVKKDGNTYTIEEIFLPAQGVNGAECEILSQGYIPIEEEMTRRGTFDRMFNDLKFWGHSHVSMDVGPSGQDRTTSIHRAQNAGDYFIRAICNKDGEMHLSFFDNAKGIAYENIDWVVDDGVDRKAVAEKFKTLVKENVLPWDVAFPKPKAEPVAVQTLNLGDRVGSPADLKRLCDDVMGNNLIPLRPTDAENWPFVDEEPKSKKVRRRSQVVA